MHAARQCTGSTSACNIKTSRSWLFKERIKFFWWIGFAYIDCPPPICPVRLAFFKQYKVQIKQGNGGFSLQDGTETICSFVQVYGICSVSDTLFTTEAAAGKIKLMHDMYRCLSQPITPEHWSVRM